jgi:tetratricopeptide (TPR) repeat protein
MRCLSLFLAVACGSSLVAPVPSLRAQDLLVAARAAAERGAMDSSYTLLSAAVDAQPNSAEAHFWLAEVAATLADRHRSLRSFFLAKRSKREFLRAVQLEPRNALYLEGLGRFLSRAPGIVGGDRDSALAVALNLRRLDAMRGISLLVELDLSGGRPADLARADVLIDAFAARPSGGREGLLRLAGFFTSRGRVERALPVAERLVADDSADAVGRYLLGDALVTLRLDPRAAARHLTWAVEHPPPVTTDARQYWPPDVWWSLGQAYAQLGATDSARSSYRNALRLEPGYRPAKRSLEMLNRAR